MPIIPKNIWAMLTFSVSEKKKKKSSVAHRVIRHRDLPIRNEISRLRLQSRRSVLTSIDRCLTPFFLSFSPAFGISFNGQTYFINAAMCTRSYHPSNELIVFDVPMPEEVSSKSPSNVNYFLGLPS